MLADSVDYVEWKTGKRNDGMIYAVEGLTGKLVGAFGQMSTALIIQHIDFVPNAPTQKPATLQGLFRLPVQIGMISTLCASIPYLFYDFRRKDQEIAVAEIQQRKAEEL
jgi:Na+/melibiose symporter-like transporter